jgi:predicted site-specific integrase-resolvase
MYVSASAFARHLNKDTKTIISWIKKGLIPNVRRLGHRFQIPIEEVEKAKTHPEYPLKKGDLPTYDRQNHRLSPT